MHYNLDLKFSVKLKDIQLSLPTPSPSSSNLRGSGGKNVNLFCRISLQSKSGKLEGMQKSEYEISKSF